MEDTNSKLGRYSAEERKERISKYRAKRTKRNFNKTIKYACRKTLADSKPRKHGRFTRNNETGEIAKAACSIREEDEDEFWFDGLRRTGGCGNKRRKRSICGRFRPVPVPILLWLLI
ncbi:hypothetical protein HS088_TW16G00680 [Tripterygium wilfordii]|uniref:CCT domain-containing protein n=1 Tax=Tripterygium wilfordii TaxID=458696 RepID=A0A7J7CJJ1_TRIWF|nr:hypothetical protein HS088_TW16G00680 [Tripterygium wilfordii]